MSTRNADSVTSAPVSPRKLAANRANARRSTGPRSAEGKAKSSLNAVRHGLMAQASLIPGENPQELAELAEEMHADARPRGAVERELVARIVSLSWRLRRVARAEEALWQTEEDCQRGTHEGMLGIGLWHDRPPHTPASPGKFVARQMSNRDGSKALERLMIYEQRLDRGLHAALRQLQQLQKIRRELGTDEEEREQDREREVQPAEETEVASESAAHDADVQNEPTAPVPVGASTIGGSQSADEQTNPNSFSRTSTTVESRASSPIPENTASPVTPADSA